MSLPTVIEEDHFSPWGSETLYNTGEAYFDSLVADIESARYSIDLESYIFARDAVGGRVAQALIDAHRRGLRVRVLMDAVGCYDSSDYYAGLLEAAGVEVKIFHPLPWQIHHYHRSPTTGSWLDKALHFISRINQRDHRKLCVIDCTHLWSGSFNISAVHLAPENGGEGWRDYGLCVGGPVVEEINQNFDALWSRGNIKLGKGLFRLYWDNLGRLARRRRNQLLLQHIDNARDHIWIVSAYFSPAVSIVKALANARRRQVDVKLIVPAHSDISLLPFLTATYYADLLNAGVKVYEYQPAMIHAKAVIIDDLHLIGSTNFNHRSFLHDLELDIQLHLPDSKQTLRQWFMQDIKDSIEVTAKSHRYSFTARLIGWCAKLIRYWV
ncbi:MAG: phosphatidylserine/phosphatidylglycerophosphate/cardiolipin synthase family protein [Gammaproteobacteria bacterium]|nr:phosphatidylserine/phosphatidylglycerophosphate/cardiolipin synthase family protein [Gammaproteobacteria bacterium]